MSGQHPVAVVTGGSQGLGAAIAKAYRARGYCVVATSRSIEESASEDYATVRGDIADPDTARRVVELAVVRFGRVDTLVNNAGIFVGGPFTGATDEEYRAIIATNLDGFFFLTRRVVELMERQGRGGHIVQMTTTLAEQANSKFPSVLAAITKGGLNAATRSLAIEYADRGIRVNAVSPGVIRTPMHPPETHAALETVHPLKGMGEIADVVRAVLYLEDSPFVTGEIMHVDGGWSAGA